MVKDETVNLQAVVRIMPNVIADSAMIRWSCIVVGVKIDWDIDLIGSQLHSVSLWDATCSWTTMTRFLEAHVPLM